MPIAPSREGWGESSQASCLRAAGCCPAPPWLCSWLTGTTCFSSSCCSSCSCSCSSSSASSSSSAAAAAAALLINVCLQLPGLPPSWARRPGAQPPSLAHNQPASPGRGSRGSATLVGWSTCWSSKGWRAAPAKHLA